MNAPLILDAATGTELSRRGHDTSLPLWSARALSDAPEALVAIHREHLQAGAELLTAGTFRTHRRSLAKGGWAARQDELNRVAVDCARQALAAEERSSLRVAGSLAPLEDCYRPDLVPAPSVLADEHALQAQSLARAGADLLLVETMNSRQEAEAAVSAGLATGLPVWCSFVSDGQGRLLSGEDLAAAALAVESLGAAAVLVNCLPVVDLANDVRCLRAAVKLPIGAQGNIGHAHDVSGWRVELMLSTEVFAEHMLACSKAGAELLGGCCGTTPDHLAALVRLLRT